MNVNNTDELGANPVFKKYIRIAMPIYGLVAISAIVAIVTLGILDEDKYAIAMIALMGVYFFATAVVLAFLPLMRKKAAQVELARYNFDACDAEVSDGYKLEQSELFMSFVIAESPFNDSENDVITFRGREKLTEYLQSVSQNVISENKVKPAFYDSVITVHDFTDDAKYTFFEVHKTPQNGNIAVEIYLKDEITFSKDGVTVNGEIFAYDDFHLTLFGSAQKMRVLLRAEFFTELNDNDGDETFSFTVRFDKTFIKIMEKFGLKFERDEVDGEYYDYLADKILNNPSEAFEQLLKYGYFKKYNKEYNKQLSKKPNG